MTLLRSWLLTAARTALDLALPPLCAVCESAVEKPGMLCAACFTGMAFITPPLCLHCGLPFASRGQAGQSGLCDTCLATPPPWGQARAALLYDANSSALVLSLKHADRQENAAILATPMARAGRALLAEAELLVPVPLHRWRLVRRGFNQAALLARSLSRASGVPTLPDALTRLRATPNLGPLSAERRRHSLDGAIAVRKTRRNRISGRRILLIDDVMTSGATASSCTTALLDAGARHVDVLVACRVADPRPHR